MRDRKVTAHVLEARRAMREARAARRMGFPDVAALRLEPKAERHMRLARWVKAERIKAGVWEGK